MPQNKEKYYVSSFRAENAYNMQCHTQNPFVSRPDPNWIPVLKVWQQSGKIS